MVPEVGVEPTRPEGHRILSPARLPFHHSGCIRFMTSVLTKGNREILYMIILNFDC